MLESTLLALILVIIVALIFDYINGFNDTANAIATCVSTRAISAKNAIIMAAILNFVGAMVSTKVATTIGQGIIGADDVTQTLMLAGIGGAIVWGLITWRFGLPSSSSHALIGGIMGAALAHVGFHALHWHSLKLIIFSLILTPILSVIIGFIVMIILLWSCRNNCPYVLNRFFRRLQIISAAIMAFAHGTADAQKSMGVITLALLSFGAIHTFKVPMVVMAGCALAMSLGTAAGGWRIMKTVGKDFVKLQPVHGFCVQTAAAIVILCASAVGMPTSTSHVITSSILGVGLSKRLSAINWKIAYHVICAWGLTIPAAAIMSMIIYTLISAVLGK